MQKIKSDVDVVILNVSFDCDPVKILAEGLKRRGLVSHIETITSAKAIFYILCIDLMCLIN